MDKELLIMLLKIIVFLPFIIFIIYLSLKYGGKGLQSMGNGNYIKIYERIPLSKESSLFVVKIGEKGYVMSCSPNKTEILMDIKEEDMINMQVSKSEFYDKLKLKLRYKKEGNHE